MAIVGWKDCPRWFKTFPEEFDRFKRETEIMMDAGITLRTNSKCMMTDDFKIKMHRFIPKYNRVRIMEFGNEVTKVEYWPTLSEVYYGWIPTRCIG